MNLDARSLSWICSSFDFDEEKWRRIFKSLFRIYPHATFITGVSANDWFFHDYRKFKCGFSKLPDETVDESVLASVAAFSLTVETKKWISVLEALCTLRFVIVFLYGMISVQPKFGSILKPSQRQKLTLPWLYVNTTFYRRSNYGKYGLFRSHFPQSLSFFILSSSHCIEFISDSKDKAILFSFKNT